MAFIKQIDFVPSVKSAFGVLETAERTPSFQGDFIHGINPQQWRYSYTFTITTVTPSASPGDVYTNSNHDFIVIYLSGATLVCYGSGSPGAAPGTLTRVTGAGSAALAYNAFTTQAGVVRGTGATVDTNGGRLRLQCGTSSTGYAYLESRRIARYRAGEGGVEEFTPLFSASAADNIQIAGVGAISNSAPYDGYFVGFSGTTFGVFHYARGSLVNFYSQSAWNGDKMDGTGPSGTNLDFSFGTPWMVKYPYLGYGDVLFFAQNARGDWSLVHTIYYANTTASTQVGNPNFRVIAYMANSGNTTNLSALVGSVGTFISGARSFVGNPPITLDGSKSITAETSIFSVKNASSYNGVENLGLLRLLSLSVSVSSVLANTVFIRLRVGAVLGGAAAFAAVSGTTTNGGVTITNGTSIASQDVGITTTSGGFYVFGLTASSGANGSGGISIDTYPFDIYLEPGAIMSFSAQSGNATTVGISAVFTQDI